VQIGNDVYGYVLALELPPNFREMRVVEERLSCNDTTIYKRHLAHVELTKTWTNQEAKFMVDWHLVALPVIQEQSESDPLRIFKNWLARMVILAPIPTTITGDSEGDSLFPDRHVANFGEWFAGLLGHAPAAYTDIDRFIRQVMPDFRDIKHPITGKESRSLVVQFQEQQTTTSIPFEYLSDGEKCFFICALLVASNRAYGPIFCFWDEPDNYLSLSEVGQFVMELRRDFKTTGGQLVATSHNSEAIRQFSNENTLLLQRRSHSEPTIVRAIADVAVDGDLVDALIRDDVEI
jgi:hypothetical protein